MAWYKPKIDFVGGVDAAFVVDGGRQFDAAAVVALNGFGYRC